MNCTGLLASGMPNWSGLKKRYTESGCSLHHHLPRPGTLARQIEPDHPSLTITRQAELLGIDRQAYYYQPVVNEATQILLKRHMDAVDAIYTDYPFYGSRRMHLELLDRFGIDIGRKRIRTAEGFVYLVAFIDWYSRYVVSWALSDTLHNGFVLRALEEALCFTSDCGMPNPDIANSDQGSHFTSEAYTEMLEQSGIRISMDGRGRCMDNIFTERLWRSVKYEEVFPSSYQNMEAAQAGLLKYFKFYNNKRRHQSLDYRSPAQVYFGLT